jgi:uncharacterized protein
MEGEKKKVDWKTVLLIIAVVLIIIGALNWGWIGLTSNNLVDTINNATFRNQTLKRVIYVIIGIAGLYVAWVLIASRLGKDKKAIL